MRGLVIRSQTRTSIQGWMLHRITAATLGEHAADEGVDESARLGNFLRRKHANAIDITLAIGVRDLSGCQHIGIWMVLG